MYKISLKKPCSLNCCYKYISLSRFNFLSIPISEYYCRNTCKSLSFVKFGAENPMSSEILRGCFNYSMFFFSPFYLFKHIQQHIVLKHTCLNATVFPFHKPHLKPVPALSWHFIQI